MIGKHEGVRNKKYRLYREAAASKKRCFNLSMEEFSSICEKNCHYCNAAPLSGGSNTWPHNGIDRKDNDVGYISWNCLPCCSMCNRAKGTKDYEAFVAYIIRVAVLRSNLSDMAVPVFSANKEVVAEFEKRCGHG